MRKQIPHNVKDMGNGIWREETTAERLAKALQEVAKENKGRTSKPNLVMLYGLKNPLP